MHAWFVIATKHMDAGRWGARDARRTTRAQKTRATHEPCDPPRARRRRERPACKPSLRTLCQPSGGDTQGCRTHGSTERHSAHACGRGSRHHSLGHASLRTHCQPSGGDTLECRTPVARSSTRHTHAAGALGTMPHLSPRCLQHPLSHPLSRGGAASAAPCYRVLYRQARGRAFDVTRF